MADICAAAAGTRSARKFAKETALAAMPASFAHQIDQPTMRPGTSPSARRLKT